jgi:hypothetical protein
MDRELRRRRKGGEMKSRVFIFITTVLVGIFASGIVWAGEVDVLLQKLVAKGLLTSSEAQEVRTETNDAMAKVEKEKQEESKKTFKDSLPDWVKSIKLGGDFRLRYEYKQDKGSVETNRPRFRLRLNIDDQVNDKVKVGMTLATGTSTAGASSTRSNNQSFQDEFSKKQFIIDKAFVDYSPKDWVHIIGGKMANPIWEPMSFVWDPDITPEGAAVTLKGKLNSSLDWFANTGLYVLQTTTPPKSPIVAFIQPGVEWRPMAKTSVKADINYYNYWNVKGNPLLTGGSSTSGNTLIGGAYRYNYNAINPTLQFEFDDPLEKLGIDLPSRFDIPYLCVFGSFLKNVDVAHGGSAYISGLKIGDKKISKFGDWQFNYAYKVLGKDAILDILPDDDFYSGLTNARGNEYFYEFGLGKNTSLKLSYYRTWKMASSQVPESHFMLDFNFKF